MPEEQAALYQTRLAAGEFVMMLEVPADRAGEYQLLLESAGAKDIHINESPLSIDRGEILISTDK